MVNQVRCKFFTDVDGIIVFNTTLYISSDVYGIIVTSSGGPDARAVDISECIGNEDQLTDCPYSLVTCDKFYLGVLCIQGILIIQNTLQRIKYFIVNAISSL